VPFYEAVSVLCQPIIGAKLCRSTSSRPTISTSVNTTWRTASLIQDFMAHTLTFFAWYQWPSWSESTTNYTLSFCFERKNYTEIFKITVSFLHFFSYAKYLQADLTWYKNHRMPYCVSNGIRIHIPEFCIKRIFKTCVVESYFCVPVVSSWKMSWTAPTGSSAGRDSARGSWAKCGSPLGCCITEQKLL